MRFFLKFPFRLALFWCFATLLPGSLALSAKEPKSGKPDGKPLLRIVCVTSLEDGQEIVIASRDEDENWHEHGTTKLRSSFISEWLPARGGDLHIAIRMDGGLRSICRFTYPSTTRRALAILLPDSSTRTYRADVIDPAELKFTKGLTLLVNYSPRPGAVALGNFRTKLKPGERKIVKARPEANGMYRMMAAYANGEKELVPCYDRYVSSNLETRDIVFLLPDSTLGLKVFSLSEFGPFE
ncbi:MAG: hypothetical protein H7A48_03015 [Akkermansiaceae bacterium]|nr:hypothetical protein [Akkermansiaceae bacterium]MCP5546934.1 hypothetical protein [Akkermansiaceae bacterium]